VRAGLRALTHVGAGLRAGPGRTHRSAPTLQALELDAPRAFARWLAAHRQALGDIVEHGTWLDREDVDALLGLSIPGIDELIGLVEIVRLAQAGTAAERESLRSSAAPAARPSGGGAPRAVKRSLARGGG